MLDPVAKNPEFGFEAVRDGARVLDQTEDHVGGQAHILELSRELVIQVVPSRIGANAGLGGAITLAAQTGAPEVLASGGAGRRPGDK